jgi:amino acid adenylation domain-containing protein
MEHGKGGPALKEFLSQTLPGYMIPSFFIPLEKIPLNPNGKIHWQALPEPAPDPGEGNVKHIAPRDEIEKKLVDIWSEVLNANVIGVGDNFFDLGGHSLNATLLVSRIHKAFNIKIPLMEFFKRGCIREVAQYIKEAGRETFTVIEPVEEREYYPLSSAQKRLYVLHQMEKDSIGYNIPAIMVLEGILDSNHLENVFIKLIERHESLRTSFTTINEEPVQKIHDHVEFKVQYHTPPPLISLFIHPFDLSRAPLMRVGLVKVEEEKHILMVDMHHIITDGTSMGLLMKDFMAFFAGKQLEPLKLRYRDYSDWQRRGYEREWEALKGHETYWLNQFPAPPPPLDLPLDYSRPAVQSFEGGSVFFEITAGETGAVKAFALEQGTTLFMVLLTLYNIFLAKITGQEDIVIGTPVAGRSHADLEPIIGMFVNTLALKNYLEAGKIFNECLEETGKRTLEAFAHQDYQYEELVEKVVENRDAGRNPLFDTMINLMNVDISELEIPGLKLTPYPYEENISKFDLTLRAFEAPDNIRFTFLYAAKLFKAETIERFTGFFKAVVSQVIRCPRVKIADIEIISEEEKKKILQDFSSPEADYPKNKTIHRLFEEQAERAGDHIALVGKAQSAERRAQSKTRHAPCAVRHALSYKKLNQTSNQLACRLRKKGVKDSTIAGIDVDRSIEMIVGILGILKTGAAYLPLDPDAPELRKRYILRDAGAQVVLNGPGMEVIHLKEKNLYPYEYNDSNHFAYVIYTSGSTGNPKGVPVTHANLLPLLYWGHDFLGFCSTDRVIQTLAYYFDWSVWEIFLTLTSGASLYIITNEILLNPEAQIDFIMSNNITVLELTPTQLGALTASRPGPGALSSLRYLCIGAEQLTVELVRRCQELLNENCRVFNMYGPTEATIISAVLEIDVKGLETYDPLPGMPIGKPVANSPLLVLDKHLNICPLHITGELYIAGDGVAKGYLNDPLKSSRSFIKNPFIKRGIRGDHLYKTGDLARWLQNPAARGAYIIEFLGRIDQQVKIRGLRIELGEVEQRLSKHETIKEAAVIDRKDSDGDKYLCAYFVSSGPAEAEELKQYLSYTLPDYMIPSFFVPLDKLPLTPNGKLDRRALPGPVMERWESYAAPRNALERGLVKLWAEVLDIEESLISIDANFFELGGHSLKATNLLSKIHRAFNAAVPLGEVFKTPTVRGVARYIKGKKQSLCIAVEAVEEKEYYALSSAQKRLYVLQQMEPDSTAYNTPAAMEVAGELHKEKLEKCFKQLIARHESLRTSFELIDDEPVQRIHKKVEFKITNNSEDKNHHFVRAFDLSKAPLLRVGLTNIEERKHLLIIDMHHIITDALSQGLLLKNFLTFYSGQSLSPLKLQYKDYSEWQNSEVQIKQIKQQEAYWLGQFAGILPLLDLPIDYPRPPVQSFEGGTVRFKIAREITEALKTVALEQGVTLQMLMMAVFHILLAKLGGQEDIITGTTTAGRRHADLDNIFGLFVNTLALRTFPAGGKTFREYLEEVKHISLDAYENQDYPFETLAKKLADQRDTSRNPLFDIAFEIQAYRTTEGDITKSRYEIPGLAFIPCDMEMNTTKFDQDWIGRETEEGMIFSVLYCTKLFKPETIELMVERYLFLIEDILADPGSRIEDLECRTPFEKELYQVKEVAFNF